MSLQHQQTASRDRRGGNAQILVKGVRPHLRGSKNEGGDEGGNPAVAKVREAEPGDAFHDDDVGQEEEEEQVVRFEQVHVLGSLLQGPEVLGDLRLLSKDTEESQPLDPPRGHVFKRHTHHSCGKHLESCVSPVTRCSNSHHYYRYVAAG